MSHKWLIWLVAMLLAGTLVFVVVTTVEGDEQPEIPNTPDELIPGLPLDGSIIIDERFWLRLVGEPGRLMQNAHGSFVDKDYVTAAKSVRDTASFLHIAADNATELAQQPLNDSAGELDRLSDRIADKSIQSAKVLEAAFARAHYAMARHHVLKAAESIEQKETEVAGGYLGSAMNHFQRAADWSNRELQSESVVAIKQGKSIVSRLLKGKSPTNEANEAIKLLRERIKYLGKFIEPAKPVAPSDKPAKTDDESMP